MGQKKEDKEKKGHKNGDKKEEKGKEKKGKKDKKKDTVAKPKGDDQRVPGQQCRKDRMRSEAGRLRKKLEKQLASGRIGMMTLRHDRLLDHIERLEAGKGNKGNAPRSPAAYYPHPAQATTEKERRPPQKLWRPKPNLAAAAREETEKLIAAIDSGAFKSATPEKLGKLKAEFVRIKQLFLDGKATNEADQLFEKIRRSSKEGKISKAPTPPSEPTDAEPSDTPTI